MSRRKKLPRIVVPADQIWDFQTAIGMMRNPKTRKFVPDVIFVRMPGGGIERFKRMTQKRRKEWFAELVAMGVDPLA